MVSLVHADEGSPGGILTDCTTCRFFTLKELLTRHGLCPCSACTRNPLNFLYKDYYVEKEEWTSEGNRLVRVEDRVGMVDK